MIKKKYCMQAIQCGGQQYSNVILCLLIRVNKQLPTLLDFLKGLDQWFWESGHASESPVELVKL